MSGDLRKTQETASADPSGLGLAFRLPGLLCFLLLALCAMPSIEAEPAGMGDDHKAMNSFGHLEPSEDLLKTDWYRLDVDARKALDGGRLDQAERLWKQSVASAESSGSIDPGVINAMCGLSLLYHRRGNARESERVYEYAMRQAEGVSGGRESAGFIKWFPDLAWLYHQHKRPQQAEILLKKALSFKQNAHGQYSQKLLKHLEDYSVFLHRSGRHTEARQLETRVQGIKKRNENQ